MKHPAAQRRIHRLAWATLGLLLLLWHSQAADAPETMRPDQLKSGMKGYGLSVFKGTKPERFEVEVLGVLSNAFPRQDLILIRLSGANLEKHKVIAGMSGSPIYISGKLIGALAYGWGFENEPLAGVTPIHNMLAELDHADTNAVASASPPVAAGKGNEAAPFPLLTPLALGGFSPRLIARAAEELAPFGFLPTAAGSHGATTGITARLEPGSAMGVELIRGDLNAVAIGTVTWVGNNRVLAFGHPFFQAGRIEAPVVQGEVHAIMSSVARSFKLASAAGEAGALIGDWQSCIVADTRRRARMIPVTMAVHNRDTGHRARYAVEVIENEALSARLVQMAIAEGVSAASASSQDTTVRIALTAELNDRTVRLTDTVFNAGGGLLAAPAIEPVNAFFTTPFGHPVVRRIDVQIEAVLQRRTAEITRAFFRKAQANRGEAAQLSVVLKPYNRPEVTLTIAVPVPAGTDSQRQLTVAVLAGTDAPPDIAPPDSQNDFFDALEKQHRGTELVLLVPQSSQGLAHRGKLLKQLPPSAITVLSDESATAASGQPDVQQIVVPTEWVLGGQAAARIPIRQE
jgi:hypothetical protein